ncbi:MAG: ABC transporter permease [Fischerella sp.]|nr:ABC transporter permease [Fischerella sp.]
MGQKLIIVIATTILLLTGLLLGYVLSQLVLGYLGLNLLTFLGTFCLILIFATLYYVLFWELRRQQSQSSTADQSQPTTELTTQRIVDHPLKNRLIAMLDGDTTAAERLVEQARQDYPGMPESWYWERAIADLERDRR